MADILDTRPKGTMPSSSRRHGGWTWQPPKTAVFSSCTIPNMAGWRLSSRRSTRPCWERRSSSTLGLCEYFAGTHAAIDGDGELIISTAHSTTHCSTRP